MEQTEDQENLRYKNGKWECQFVQEAAGGIYTCRKLLSRLDQARSHLADHSDISRKQCSVCLYTFSCASAMRRHKKKCDSLTVNRSELCCDKELSLAELKVHKKNVHCGLCDFVARFPSLLQPHTESAHQPGLRFYCSVESCKAEFSREVQLRYHIKNHSKNKRCELCGKFYGGYYRQHRQTHKTKTCEKCFKTVKFTSFSRHKKVCQL